MKNLFLVIICFIAPFVASAQLSGSNTQLGFTVSPNLGWLSGDGSINDGTRAGVSYGLLADLALSSNYYFSSGFTITSINGRAMEEQTSTNYKIKYIEVPLTLKLKSQPTSIGRYYGQFGLGTGYKIGAKADISEGVGTTKRTDVDISSNINFFRISMIAGAGVEWKVNESLNVMTGLTYNNGFTSMNDEGTKIKNSYLALTLGIFF
ncbi:porin family protein [Arcticibacter eurypsychrophilus]|uniref:porin family protein n=1 Tax=Arcticibacter eurypsychrophilus TaxID=1434752 RepID=UPI00084D3716|nr:porin family protein [Arcticibacter eurypsychrophilus]